MNIVDIFVETPTEFRSAEPEPKSYTKRLVWRIKCSDGRCDGTKIDLGQNDQGKPLLPDDVVLMGNIEVVSNTGTVAILKWGTLHTFTIDAAQGTVQYVGEGGSAHGVGTCKGKNDG
jgi:hypothetical protein